MATGQKTGSFGSKAIPIVRLSHEVISPRDAASGLPTRTMGREIGEDPLFFAAALASGRALAAAAASNR